MQTENTQIHTTEGKNMAIIAYLTIIGLIIAFVMNNEKHNPFAKYHIKQSLGLVITGFLLGVIGLIPILGWIINIIGFVLLFILWIIGLVNAINREQKPIPLLGKHYEKWLQNL